MKWVQWSTYNDTNGKPMVQIGSGHYPIDLAQKIASELSQLLLVKNEAHR